MVKNLFQPKRKQEPKLPQVVEANTKKSSKKNTRTIKQQKSREANNIRNLNDTPFSSTSINNVISITKNMNKRALQLNSNMTNLLDPICQPPRRNSTARSPLDSREGIPFFYSRKTSNFPQLSTPYEHCINLSSKCFSLWIFFIGGAWCPHPLQLLPIIPLLFLAKRILHLWGAMSTLRNDHYRSPT